MLAQHLSHKLAQFEAQDLLRTLKPIEAQEANRVLLDGRSLINFCTNDYLHLAKHAAVKQAFIKGVNDYGLGSGASAQVSGYSKAHRLLEEEFAAFLQRERALLFNSGYHANLGVLSALANRHSKIIADKYCHASILDGIVLSRAKHLRYPHQNLAQLNTLLSQSPKKPALLVTESIFSMQGDISPLDQIAPLAKQHQALLMVDDAHGIGVLGKTGRGICEHYHLNQDMLPCLITPFGKSLGSFGAVVSGSKAMIEVLLQFARTHRYSTALPPAVCEATRAALLVLQQEPWRREKLQTLIQLFNESVKQRQLNLFSSDATPIKLIQIGENKKALALQKNLAQQGFFVSCIRSPTLPPHAASIRISLNCLHTAEEITSLLDVLAAHAKAS
jgi:8-amino-7-oxononanoate synthase